MRWHLSPCSAFNSFYCIPRRKHAKKNTDNVDAFNSFYCIREFSITNQHNRGYGNLSILSIVFFYVIYSLKKFFDLSFQFFLLYSYLRRHRRFKTAILPFNSFYCIQLLDEIENELKNKTTFNSFYCILGETAGAGRDVMQVTFNSFYCILEHNQ